MNNEKSMLEVAYEVVGASSKSLTFKELYDEVATKLAMNDDEKNDRIGNFYTQLTLDGKFVVLMDNTWDLRSRHTYDKVHIDMSEVYSDVNTADDDQETKKETDDYNAEIEGKPLDDEEGVPLDEEGDEKAPEETLSSLGVN